MGLYLEILSGELKGTRTPAREGTVIGRKQGQLTIRDSKLSGKHAEIQARGDDELWLVDLGSQNGIKLDGKKLGELKLEAGVKFILGRTEFQVISSDEKLDEDEPDSVRSATTTRTYWDTLIDLAARAATGAKESPREIAAFSPPLKLKFTRGVQTGTQWTIGYGPRTVGPNSIDLKLEEKALPEVCFRLEPKGSDVIFKDESGGLAKLNGKSAKVETLKNGDVIEIKNTQIQVEWDEGQ